MLKANGVAIVSVLAALTVAPRAAQDPDPRATFRADVDLTVVEVTVRGRDGQLLTDLRQDEFQITDGKARLPIEQFAVDRQPLTAVVMVQTKGDVPAHQAWATRLVDALENGDRLSIGSYSTEVVVNPLLTSDREVLRRILDEEIWYGLHSPVSAAFHRAALALPGGGDRSAVILIGVDTMEPECLRQAPCVTSDAARETMAARGVLPYGIVTGLESAMNKDRWNLMPGEERSGTMDGRLLRIVKGAGGYLATRSMRAAEEAAAARGVLEQLRVRYVMGFVPRTAGATDEFRLNVARPGASVLVQTRRTVRRHP